jgi:uncharacterized protein YbjT (DUF2867 family)
LLGEHQVAAYTRLPNKINREIAIVTGGLTDEQAILKALNGVDALGSTKNYLPDLLP